MHRTLIPLIVLAGCQIQDGDLAASSAVLSVTLDASTDALAQRATRLTGTLELGYTGPDLVSLTVEDNGVPVYTGTFAADRMQVPVDVLVAPLDEGTNLLVARASYRDATASTSLTVELPPGLSDLALATPAVPDELATTVVGSVDLGWDSPDPASVAVTVEGVLAATSELPGVAGPAVISVPVTLPHGGANEVVVDVSYGEARRRASVVVGVAEPIVSLVADPDAPTTSTFSSGVSGTVEVGYRSERPARLEILADGAVVHSELLDVSADTSVPFSALVPLAHPGENTLVTRVTYDGADASDTDPVDMEPPAPDVTLPSWALDYVPGVSMVASGPVGVTPPAGWEVRAVRGSQDGGLTWVDATAQGAGFLQAFDTPDIQQPVRLAVELTNRGIPVTWDYEDVLPVEVIFDCNSPSSMVPTSDLLRDMNTEFRTLVGYFGDPDGPHAITFVIESDTDAGPYPEVGNTLQRGPFSVDVSFNVDEYRCGGGCTQNYSLEALLDGVTLCFDPTFGRVEEQGG